MAPRFISVIVAGLLLIASLASATAQDATPAAPFEGVDLPTLDVTATEGGYVGIPEELTAGRYLITLTSEIEEGAISFLQPTDMTIDEFLALNNAESAESDGATPAADSASAFEQLLVAFHAAILPGGVVATPEQPGQVVLDLTPGEWLVWAEGTSIPGLMARVTVTGEMPADLPEPVSSATITMNEYDIEVSEGELTAGTQVVKVENTGEQAHFIEFAKGPEGLTEKDVEDAITFFMTGTPAPDATVNVEELMPLLYTVTQSSGTTMWIPITLTESGTHILACWFPDLGDGSPHAVHGMHTIVEVGE